MAEVAVGLRRTTTSWLATVEPLALGTGGAAALALRLLIGGRPAPHSVLAALAFTGALLALCAAAGWRPAAPSWRGLAVGAVAGAGLCVPPLVRAAFAGHLGSLGVHGYVGWAAVVSGVAVAEELLVRGVLYDAVRRVAGDPAAVAVGALLFALLHVALYGWAALPLDLAVGLLLGCLRWVTGTVAAPAAAHTLADLASWWLR